MFRGVVGVRVLPRNCETGCIDERSEPIMEWYQWMFHTLWVLMVGPPVLFGRIVTLGRAQVPEQCGGRNPWGPVALQLIVPDGDQIRRSDVELRADT